MLNTKDRQINFILCSLSTLWLSETLFSCLLNTSNSQLEFNTDCRVKFVLDKRNSSTVKNLLNKRSIRTVAYTLIAPLFNESGTFTNLRISTKGNLSKSVLLKQYLKKYHINYTRYFSAETGNSKNLITDKEINSMAIKSLIIISGLKP